jgi:thymidylate synthase (FAD)
MKIQKQNFVIVHPLPLDRKKGLEMLKVIEKAGRTCYKSEDKITDDSAETFVKMLINRGHESVLEHQSLGIKFICDRGVSHEFVRHRLSSFSQESTRYCNYDKEKFGREINVIEIEPHFKNPSQTTQIWESAMESAETSYRQMIDAGETPQIARSVLPNSLKTEIVISANLRQWREMFRQRCAKAAHPQMRELMVPLHKFLKSQIPVIFDDIEY